MKIQQSMIAMIPARIGSTRLAKKNLALINGKPMIYYAVQAAIDSGIFSRIVINSEDSVFEKIADRYNVDFYKRPPQHATSTAKSDAVVYDFMKNNPGDIVAWVNPTSPLQEGAEVREVIDSFIKRELDSLITTCDEQVHHNFDGKPLNYDSSQIFAQTQDLIPVKRFVYSIMMWRCSTFINAYDKKGHALFCGKFGTHQVNKLSGLIIKKEEDLRLIDYIMVGKQERGQQKLLYDPLAADKGAK